MTTTTPTPATPTSAGAKSSFDIRSLSFLLVPIIGFGITVLLHTYFDWNSVQQQAVYASTVRGSAPLLLGALVGIIGEKSGIVNIGIEGQMTLTGFAAFFAAAGSGSLFVGIAAALVVGMLTGLFMGWAAITIKMDHIIAGTVLNVFAGGFTNYYYAQGRTMPRFPNWNVPGLEDVPWVGKIMFSHGPMVYVAVIGAAVLHFALNYTRWGLRTKAVGEHPSAADTVGISVAKLRYRNIILAGAVAGLAGLAILQSASSFSNTGFSSGRGFIALAVMLFGRYRPFGALGAALLFGYFSALQSQLQLFNTIDIPSEFIGMIPYAFTVIVLAALGYAARSPAALGQPFEKD